MGEVGSNLRVSAATHKGYVRRVNEDAIIVGDWIGCGGNASRAFERAVDGRGLLLAVADGLGGHRAGEVASRFLIEELSRRAQPETLEQEDRLVALLREIDAELRHRTLEAPSLRGMGSTLAAAYVSVGRLTVTNVGDSRAYVLDEKHGLRQVSVDHVPRPVPGRPADPTGPSDNPRGSAGRRTTQAITQAFGGNSSRLRPLRPHVVQLPAPEGEWALLLCSDGLSDFVDERALGKALSSKDMSADDLVGEALAAGGEDNVSVILARCKPVVRSV